MWDSALCENGGITSTSNVERNRKGKKRDGTSCDEYYKSPDLKPYLTSV